MEGTRLQDYLNRLRAGELEAGTIQEVERLLYDCWSELQLETDDGGLEPYKLLKRTEGLTWHPPLLTFDIERHRGTVHGSIYAEVHSWQVDVERGKASLINKRRRQVGERDKVLKVEPIAEELAQAIHNHQADPRLKWAGTDTVRVLIGVIIPATVQQTTISRRRRFWKALEERLEPQGWIRKSARSQVFNLKLPAPSGRGY